jgi:hypothetical protein
LTRIERGDLRFPRRLAILVGERRVSGPPRTPPSAAPVGIAGAGGCIGGAATLGDPPPEPTPEQPTKPSDVSVTMKISIRRIV